jgi:hypothetical protein
MLEFNLEWICQTSHTFVAKVANCKKVENLLGFYSWKLIIYYVHGVELLHLFAFENISLPSIFKCHSCGSQYYHVRNLIKCLYSVDNMESLSKYKITMMQNNCEQYVKNCFPYHSKHFLQINAFMWHGIIHKSYIEGILFGFILWFLLLINIAKCRNPILEEWEDDSLTPKMGTWEFVGTPETSKFNCKGQNTSHRGVLYIIGKLSKCKCRKWAHMSHLDIWSTSYDEKKGRESN